MSINTRVGIGYDIHPLVSGRKLILGGVEIPYEKGLDGWSDADVLTHAVIDALLGAAALGDIGQHFPAGDLDWKEALSLFLLDKVVKKLDGRGYRIGNIDVTVVAEQPYLHDYIGKMRENLSETLRIDLDNVSVKASSNNGIGHIGAGEGIAAYAVAMIEEFKNLKPKPGN
jgi:2-C-methyl-D-erythritol 2,4-cyclodiphosphate synthase